jgi:hypothetical protein
MSNTYLYWSFQSVHNKDLEVGSQEFETYKLKYKKDFKTRELYSDAEILEEYRINSWRNPLFNTITSLILAKEYKGELVVDYITGEEKDLLQTFKNKLKTHHSNCQLVHFDAEIILPYIGVRFDINGFNPQTNLIHQDLKYQGHNFKSWNFSGIDLKEYYKGGGKYSFSLEEIANIKGVKHDFIPYDSEYTYYHNNDFKALKDSAINKVVVIANIHRKIFGLPDIEYKLLEDFVQNVEEQKPTNWLHELERSNQLTLEIVANIKEQILSAKKKPTKRDKEVLFETIRAVYVKNDFEHNEQDAKKTIELKEKQITD